MIGDDPLFLPLETDVDDLRVLSTGIVVYASNGAGPAADDRRPKPEAPPALPYATVAAVKPWRGLMIAGALHLVVLTMALGLFHWHKLPHPAPQGITISLLVQKNSAPAANSTAALSTAQPQAAVAQPRLNSAAPDLPPVPSLNKPDTNRATTAPQPVLQASQTASSRPLMQRSHTPDKAMQSSDGDTRPARALSKLNVYYSLYSQEIRQQGQVGLEVSVLPNGSPGNVVIIRSSGSKALDNVARNAVLGLRFVPAMKNGVAVASVLQYPFKFEPQQSGN